MAGSSPFDADVPASALLAEQNAGDNAAPLSVSELSAILKRVVEDRFGFVRLRGELSGVKRAASGHFYCSLKDENADVREQAAFALGQIRDRAAVEALVIAIKDPSPDVREQVAFALGQLRDPRAIDALTTALKDANADVRQKAAFALGQLAR
mgnify:CR=1 FL=1